MSLSNWTILSPEEDLDRSAADRSPVAGTRRTVAGGTAGAIPLRWVLGCLTAIVCVGLGALVSRQWPALFERQEVVPFCVAVVAAAVVGGGLPAAVAVALSAVALELWVPGAAPRPTSAWVVGVFSLGGAGFVTVMLRGRRTRALARVARAKADLERRVERQREELAGAVSRLRREIQRGQRTEDELRSVTAHVRCILWRAELGGDKDWTIGVDGAQRLLAWKVWVQDEQAAQSVLPLDVSETGSYYHAWVRARHPEDAENESRVCRAAVLRGESSYSHEYRCYDRDGRERWLHEEVQIHRLGPGRVRLFGVTTDATERKLAEREVHEHRTRLRTLASEVSKSEERERRQIAAALHDQLGSLLAVAQMQLDGLRMADGEDGLSEAHSAVVDDVIQSIEEAIGHTRSLTCELSPPLLYEAGLEAAVRWLGEQVRRRHGLVVRVASTGDVRGLDQELGVLLFQGVRELLTNTVKHARASVARVDIEVAEDGVRVAVLDDGVGLGQSTASRPNGFGLFHLRERIEHLGGAMEVTSEPGKGTQTVMLIPRGGRRGA
jgi:signal transduction histidine kinase